MRGGDNMPSKQDGRSIRKEKNQLMFLSGLKKMGTVSSGLRSASIDRSTYKYWMAHDPDFSDRVADARQDFAEALEEVVVGIVMDPEAVKKSPILAITLLNANMPSKYRPTAIVQEDTARELLREWRKTAQNAPKKEEEKSKPVEQQIEDILEEKYQDGGS
jgi:hypothetical protein|tara:strand:+ start:315 stop:797 length:483 start_codon:yes stop_codon:yes gene_type:complete